MVSSRISSRVSNYFSIAFSLDISLSLSLCNSMLVERLYDIFVKYSVEICRPNPWPTLVINVSFQVTKVLSAK